MRKIDKDEMNEVEKIRGRTLKRIFNLPISTLYIGFIMKRIPVTKEYNIVR